VASANILAGPLRAGKVTDATLAAIQKRREFPVRVTQKLQVFVQNNMIDKAPHGSARPTPPLPIKLAQMFPVLQRLPARLVGMGARPEHVHTGEANFNPSS
jgi:hypothetical protein